MITITRTRALQPEGGVLRSPVWLPGDVRVVLAANAGLQKLAGSGSTSLSATNTTVGPGPIGKAWTIGWNGAASRILTIGSDSSITLNTSSGMLVGMVGSTSGAHLLTTSYTGGFPGNNGFALKSDWPKIAMNKTNIAEITSIAQTGLVTGQQFCIAWSYNSSTGRARIACNGRLGSATSTQTFTHATVVMGSLRGDSTNASEQAVSFFLLSGAECFSDSYLVAASLNPWLIYPRSKMSIDKGSVAGGLAAHPMRGGGAAANPIWGYV